jgi:hypothetical protein
MKLVTLVLSCLPPEQPRTRQKGMHLNRKSRSHHHRRFIRRTPEARQTQARGNENYEMETLRMTPIAEAPACRYGNQTQELAYATMKAIATSTTTITQKIVVRPVVPPRHMVHNECLLNGRHLPAHDLTEEQHHRTQHSNYRTGMAIRNNEGVHRRLFQRMRAGTRTRCIPIRHLQAYPLTPSLNQRSSLWTK